MAELQLLDARDIRVEQIWRRLEATAWGSIENGLACLPDRERPRLVRFALEDRLKEVKHAVSRWRQRRLTAGVPSRDMTRAVRA